MNSSGQTNSLKDLLQNKIDDMEKQVLSRVNTLEESKPGSRNDTEQRNRVETTLTSLHHRITDLEKGASGCQCRQNLKLLRFALGASVRWRVGEFKAGSGVINLVSNTGLADCLKKIALILNLYSAAIITLRAVMKGERRKSCIALHISRPACSFASLSLRFSLPNHDRQTCK